MGSLISGYNYDIFISYRRKDNKHDGWVTEFVNNLKGELESTFKDEISVYFDENPADGLLEIHNVDKSLENKLKCLIFIPVVSQTYCDPKSFAWQHELCAFNRIAKEDEPGRDIKLASGNVISRILPVRIHELDPDDKAMLEDELGGVLRSIDFIFKSSGVNRPLIPDDNPDKNLNKTNYRDQLNKVANAVKDIICALRSNDSSKKPYQVSEKELISGKKVIQKTITKLAIGLALVILVALFLNRLLKNGEVPERSIAVLPFINESPVDSNKYFINGIMEEVLNNLQLIGDFRVLSRTSTSRYKGPDKSSISDIAKDLGVNYIVEGSGQKYGSMFRMRVQLIRATGKEDHLWGKTFELKLEKTADLFRIQSDISRAIAFELKTVLTPVEKLMIDKVPTIDMTAYNLYLKAEDYKSNFQSTYDLSSYKTSVNLYNAALEVDSMFARAYTGLSEIYGIRYFYQTYFKENFLDSAKYFLEKAISIDDRLPEAYFIKGMISYLYGDGREAVANYDKALRLKPNYSRAYGEKGRTLTWLLHDFVAGIEDYQKALTLIRGEERPGMIKLLARAYLDAGFVEQAKNLYGEAYKLDGKALSYMLNMSWLEYSNGNFIESVKFGHKATAIDSAHNIDLFIYNISGNDEEAFFWAKKMAEEIKRGQLTFTQTHRIGYAYYKIGKTREADYFFNEQLRYGLEGIKLNRLFTQRRASHYDLAATYAFLGQKDKAYKYLAEFSKLDFYQLWWVTLIKNDPLFDSIRGEERFQTLIREVEKKHKAEHDRVEKWMEKSGMRQE